MSDQCKNCVSRGNVKKCQLTHCYQHESWMVNKLHVKIRDLESQVRLLKQRIRRPNTGTASEAQQEKNLHDLTRHT